MEGKLLTGPECDQLWSILLPHPHLNEANPDREGKAPASSRGQKVQRVRTDADSLHSRGVIGGVTGVQTTGRIIRIMLTKPIPWQVWTEEAQRAATSTRETLLGL